MIYHPHWYHHYLPLLATRITWATTVSVLIGLEWQQISEFTNFLFQSPVILLPSLISKMVWEIDYLVPLPCMGLHGKIVLLTNTCTAPVPSSWKLNSKIWNGSTTKTYQDHKRICYHAFSDNNYVAYTWKLSVAIISAAAAAACGSIQASSRRPSSCRAFSEHAKQ